MFIMCISWLLYTRLRPSLSSEQTPLLSTNEDTHRNSGRFLSDIADVRSLDLTTDEYEEEETENRGEEERERRLNGKMKYWWQFVYYIT